MLVVSDASPIMALAACGKLDLLDKLFAKICIPKAVYDELNVPGKPKSSEITAWAKDKIIPVKDMNVVSAFSLTLDTGEAEALALYLENNADFLLIDEKRGRTIAYRNEINTIGTIGILLFAKQKGLILQVKPLLDILAQTGFRISGILYNQILERAGEK